jgi:hypothetical protein
MLDASDMRDNYESIRGSSKFSRYQMQQALRSEPPLLENI